MDRVVVVLSANMEGAERAAPYIRQLVSQSEAPPVVVAVGEDWEDVPGIAVKLLGSPTEVVYAQTAAAAVNELVARSLEDGVELLHVVQSDVMISPVWRREAMNGRMMWCAVGPAGPQLTGSQFVRIPESTLRQGFNAAATWMAGSNAGQYGRADWLDPECFALNLTRWKAIGPLDTNIPDLGWALRDWCLRVRELGTRVAVALSCYAMVVDPGRLNPWQVRGVEGRLAYYGKHEDRTTRGDHKLAACWVVQPQSPHQLSMLMRSIPAAAAQADFIFLALVDHPKGFLRGSGPKLDTDTLAWLSAISKEDDENVAAQLLAQWVEKLIPETTRAAPKVVCTFIPPGWSSLQQLDGHVTNLLAELGATWCLRLTEGDVLEALPDDYLPKLMRHPDPMVVAYNVGIVYTWETENLVREDAPFGDGGSLLGDANGTNDWRLYRTTGSRFASDGGRLANIRLKSIGLEDPAWRKPGPTTGMRVSQFSRTNRIGLHMLGYPGEAPDNLARWLDWTHGLTDAVVLVWNGGDLTSAASMIVDAFQIGCRMDPGADVHFARWRNLGLDVLERADVHWGWFVDPDEWVGHPVHDLLAIRRMAEQDNRFAWLFDFNNHRAGGALNTSEAIRMNRLGLGMEFDGRVHETFGGTVEPPQQGYGKQGIGRAPFRVHNRGTADHEIGVAKLALYTQLVREELAENPYSARHWITLSYDYASHGHEEEALECIERAIDCASATAYLPWFERAMLRLRAAKGDLRAALQRLPSDHRAHGQSAAVLRSLEGVADATPAAPGSTPEPLPEFPSDGS